jgi:hypothetical protein
MTTPQDIADRWPAVEAAFASEGVTIRLPQALALLPKLGAVLANQPIPVDPSTPSHATPLLSDVDIVNAPDVRGWKETSRITRVAFDGKLTTIEHTQQDTWPEFRPAGWQGDLQATVWLFLSRGDRWVGSAFIQLWKGAHQIGDLPNDFHKNWYYGTRWTPMEQHGPIRQGEPIGFLVSSGNCRDSVGPFSVMERSNLVIVPAADVAEYRWDA